MYRTIQGRGGGKGPQKKPPPEPRTRIRGTAGNIRHTHLVLVTYLDEHNIIPRWRYMPTTNHNNAIMLNIFRSRLFEYSSGTIRRRWRRKSWVHFSFACVFTRIIIKLWIKKKPKLVIGTTHALHPFGKTNLLGHNERVVPSSWRRRPVSYLYNIIVLLYEKRLCVICIPIVYTIQQQYNGVITSK